jgi:hypothetical protein
MSVATSAATLLPLISPHPESAFDRRDTKEVPVSLAVSRATPAIPRVKGERERRATPRMHVMLACEQRIGDVRLRHYTTDISTFGLSLRDGPTPKRGSRLTLSLLLPDLPGKPLKMRVQVLGSYDERGGMRLRFYNPPLESVRRVHRYLNTQI